MATICLEWAGSGTHFATIPVDSDWLVKSSALATYYARNRWLQCRLAAFVPEAKHNTRKLRIFAGHNSIELTHANFGVDDHIDPNRMCCYNCSNDVHAAWCSLWDSLRSAADVLLVISLYDDATLAEALITQLKSSLSVIKSFALMSHELRSNPRVVKAALQRSRDAIKSVAEDAKTKDVMLLACTHMYSLKYTPDSLLNDKDYFVQWAGKNFRAVQCFTCNFRYDEDVVLAALRDKYMYDSRVVLLAATRGGCYFDRFCQMSSCVNEDDTFDFKASAILFGILPAAWFRDDAFVRKALQAHSFLLSSDKPSVLISQGLVSQVSRAY